MRLKFKNPHLSITSFEPIDLPQLTVITGPNGVGKTHLLKAIADGQISNDVTTPTDGMIRFVDNALNVRDAETVSRSVADGESDEIAQAFFKLRDNARLLFWMKNVFPGITGVTYPENVFISEIYRITTYAIGNVDEDRREFARENLEVAVRDASRLYLEMIKDLKNATRMIQATASRRGVPVFEVTQSEVEDDMHFGNSDFLEQSFSRVFMTYHQRFMENKVRHFLRSEGQNVSSMTDEEFVKRFGPPPWSFVDDLLQIVQPNLSINKPVGYPLRHFTAYLIRNSDGRPLSYSMLSSGERVLFILCSTIWRGLDERISTVVPKVLLLDEVDATLHPSWVPRFLRAIKDFFVQRMNMHVILTTHSPTTVALADEGSVFVMDAEPRRLRDVTRNRAIIELTTEVPILSLSFDGRRQVFVESPSDAVIYERLYAILRPRLNSERSLQFIPAGTGGEGSGCVAVRRIVDQLTAAGNATVFGLLDWDCENDPSDRVRVLAYTKRNGLENVLLDPLLIACLIVREVRYHLSDLELSNSFTWRTLVENDFEQAPALASTVENLVLGEESADERAECVYDGGITLQLRLSYLRHDDHRLEEAIKQRFPALRSIKGVGPTRNVGALSNKIVESVLAEYPELIPREIVDTFLDILNA